MRTPVGRWCIYFGSTHRKLSEEDCQSLTGRERRTTFVVRLPKGGFGGDMDTAIRMTREEVMHAGFRTLLLKQHHSCSRLKQKL